jgi:hypothetical protein
LIGRPGTVAIAILLTIFKDRFWKPVSAADEPVRKEQNRPVDNQGDLAVGLIPVVA